jgi:hypothetical protein
MLDSGGEELKGFRLVDVAPLAAEFKGGFNVCFRRFAPTLQLSKRTNGCCDDDLDKLFAEVAISDVGTPTPMDRNELPWDGEWLGEPRGLSL